MVDDGSRGPTHGPDRPDRSEKPERGDRPERSDRGDRGARGDAPLSDPDAEPTEDELRAAAALREALSATEQPASPGGRREPVSDGEARWLAAHLRVPTADDSLGEVRARRLARAARESVSARRAVAARRGGSLRQLGRSLSGTGGLLAAATLLLIVSWVLLDQGSRLRQRTMSPTVASALVYRRSLHRAESPSLRIDLMLQERLLSRRSGGTRATPQVIAASEKDLAPPPAEARLLALRAGVTAPPDVAGGEATR